MHWKRCSAGPLTRDPPGYNDSLVNLLHASKRALWILIPSQITTPVPGVQLVPLCYFKAKRTIIRRQLFLKRRNSRLKVFKERNTKTRQTCDRHSQILTRHALNAWRPEMPPEMTPGARQRGSGWGSRTRWPGEGAPDPRLTLEQFSGQEISQI